VLIPMNEPGCLFGRLSDVVFFRVPRMDRHSAFLFAASPERIDRAAAALAEIGARTSLPSTRNSPQHQNW